MCRTFHQVPVDHLFRRWGILHFGLLSLPPSHPSFLSLYRSFHADFGRYTHCYLRIKRALDTLQARLGAHLVRLNPGLDEDTIEFLEDQVGVSLPLDLRCAYRLAGASPFCFVSRFWSLVPDFWCQVSCCGSLFLLLDGQAQNAAVALFGHYTFYDFHAEYSWVPLAASIAYYEKRRQANAALGLSEVVFPFSASPPSGELILVALSAAGGHVRALSPHLLIHSPQGTHSNTVAH